LTEGPFQIGKRCLDITHWAFLGDDGICSTFKNNGGVVAPAVLGSNSEALDLANDLSHGTFVAY
jgi:hypothetical protein